MLKKITLEEEQERAISIIRDELSKGNKKLGVQMMTGAGKTIIARDIILKAILNKKKVFFILKGNSLMAQSIDKAFNDIPLGVIWANKTRHLKRNLIVCSQPTYTQSRLKYKKILEKGDIFFIDEAHEATSDGYEELLSDIPEGKIVIGLSATFLRGVNGKGHTFWDKVITPVSASELVEKGKIPKLDILFPEVQGFDLTKVGSSGDDYNRTELYNEMKGKVIYGNMINLYNTHNQDKLPTIAFCINIQHCEDVAREFKKIGVLPLMIHSRMKKEKKEAFNKNLDYYLSLNIPFIICSVDMLSKGVDIPKLKVGIHLRPTKSKKLYFQQVGRLTRKENRDSEVDEKVLLIDMSNNYLVHGDPLQPFSPEQEDVKRRPKGEKKKERMRTCEACGAKNEPYLTHCIVCNTYLLKDIDIKNIDVKFRMASFEERDVKVKKTLNSAKHISSKYMLSDSWRYEKIYKDFGSEMFFKSKNIPEEVKIKKQKQLAKEDLKKTFG